MSSPRDDKEEEAGLSDSSSESDSNRFRFFATGGFAPFAFLGGGGGGGLRLQGGWLGVVVALAPSLSSFTSFASPPPIPRQSPASSHPNPGGGGAGRSSPWQAKFQPSRGGTSVTVEKTNTQS